MPPATWWPPWKFHWTSPHRRQLEVDLQKSEKKYHAIFSNIPNPVFVLDVKTLQIMDCNKSVTAVYGYPVDEMVGQSFMTLFHKDEQDHYAFKVVTCSVINQARHLNREGKGLFVNIRISPSEYSGQKVLLVTTSDITKRLETEQQLIQASKMATLGEMATGVAHELNQPLSVIKTVSSFFMKKLGSSEPIAPDVLSTMLGKVDGNVDRAARIINHMRQFARKSDTEKVAIQLNDVLKSAFEIFSQQLKVRGIQVVWEIREPLPRINADPSRLEQVFINLLLNARDAIESQWGDQPAGNAAGEKNHPPVDRHRKWMGGLPGLRHGYGHCGQHGGKNLRTVFHHQGGGQGHGIGTFHQLRHRQGVRRPDRSGAQRPPRHLFHSPISPRR